MKGYRTLVINAGMAVILALLTWAAGVDWTGVVSPTVAVIIVAAVNAGLRVITDTAIGKSV